MNAAVLSLAIAILGLAPADERKVRDVNASYVSAWRSNDRAAVVATLWPDAVLIPQGNAPVEGLDAINRFWWPPDGPATTVTGFTATTDEIGGSGALAFVWGTFQLDFSYEDKGKSVTGRNRGNYLMIFTRRGTEWRISHRMWGDRK